MDEEPDSAFVAAAAQADFSLQVLDIMRQVTQKQGSFTKTIIAQILVLSGIPPEHAIMRVNQVMQHFQSMLESDGDRYRMRDDSAPPIADTMELFRRLAGPEPNEGS